MNTRNNISLWAVGTLTPTPDQPHRPTRKQYTQNSVPEHHYNANCFFFRRHSFVMECISAINIQTNFFYSLHPFAPSLLSLPGYTQLRDSWYLFRMARVCMPLDYFVKSICLEFVFFSRLFRCVKGILSIFVQQTRTHVNYSPDYMYFPRIAHIDLLPRWRWSVGFRQVTCINLGIFHFLVPLWAPFLLIHSS